jgi:hypothetical protein
MKSSDYFFDEEFFMLSKVALKSYVHAYLIYEKLKEKNVQGIILTKRYIQIIFI